jgi:hypothetical protein
VLAAKINRGDDICHVAATGDQAGPTVNHGIVDLSRRVITRVASFDELSAQAGFEGSNACFVQHDFLLSQNRPIACCARAVSEQVFPPSRVMNSRRCMCLPENTPCATFKA